MVPLAGTANEAKLNCSLSRAGRTAVLVAGPGAERVQPRLTLSLVDDARFQEYGIVGEQVAVVPLRVASTVSDSMISFPLPTSSNVAVAVHRILAVLLMFDFTVIVKLNTKVPVKVIVAGGSALALSTCGSAINVRVCGSKYPRTLCVPAKKRLRHRQQACTDEQEDRGPNSHENTSKG